MRCSHTRTTQKSKKSNGRTHRTHKGRESLASFPLTVLILSKEDWCLFHFALKQHFHKTVTRSFIYYSGRKLWFTFNRKPAMSEKKIRRNTTRHNTWELCLLTTWCKLCAPPTANVASPDRTCHLYMQIVSFPCLAEMT